MSGGRPTKYSSEMIDKIRILYAQGKTDEQVAELVGVSRTTLHTWMKRHAEFLNTLKNSKELVDDTIERSLYERATGYSVAEEKVFMYRGEIITHTVMRHYPPDPTAMIFWLKNRRPREWRDRHVVEVDDSSQRPIVIDAKVDFQTFCARANYANPYDKQMEMRRFAFDETDPRLLLGSRGYGKTDYVTVMGVAYDVYLQGPDTTNLLVTKSKSRNTALMEEIAKALVANGVALEKSNSTCIRISGLQGKDHSVEAVTIKTSVRGRHPKRVIMDDPVTDEDVSEATRLQVKRKFNEIMKLCANVVVIGQPAHKYDLYAELRPMVKLLEIPFGTIPELDHDLEAQRMAGVDEASIQASYYLKVISEDASPFERVRTIASFGPGDSVAFIDPSFEGGDFTAMSIIRKYLDGIAVVGFTWKKAWNHCLDDMVEKMKRFGVQKVCFETNSLGSMPLDILGNAVGANIGVTGRKSNSNKHARILAAGTYAHLIHISDESDRVYKDQVLKYEYNAKNDDAPDSLASCLEWVGLIRGKN